MKRYGNIFPTVTDFHHLYNSAHWAVSGKKNKYLVQDFFLNLEPELLQLQSDLLDKSYQPRPYHLFFVSDPKVRLICAPDFRDQVVHHSLCSLLEPIFEKTMIHHSYACRVGKVDFPQFHRHSKVTI
jgi:retron-type reverse transcriptase